MCLWNNTLIHVVADDSGQVGALFSLGVPAGNSG